MLGGTVTWPRVEFDSNPSASPQIQRGRICFTCNKLNEVDVREAQEASYY